MASLTDVFVAVLPQTDKFEPELKRKLARIDASSEGRKIGRSVMSGAEKETRKGGRAFASVGQSMGNGLRAGMLLPLGGISKAFVGAFAAIGAAKVFGSFISEARESEKISRITANAIRATGGAAKISAGQVGDLAESISNKTGMDDEAIQSGANLLLTFKNIRNEVGKGNDIFNRATQAAADLSAAGFGDLNGASKQLGKALNDPIKGISALGRAGVTFTAQQKEQIKTLVESGNVLGAQRIILKEVESQVGGAAQAAADPIDRLKVVMGNLGEDIGRLLLPVVGKFADFLSNRVIPGVTGLITLFAKGDFTGEFGRAFGIAEDSGFVEFLFRVRDAFIGLFNLVVKGDFTGALRRAFSIEEDSGFVTFVLRARDAVISFAQFVVSTVLPALGRFAQAAGQVLGQALQAVARFISTQVVPALAAVGRFVSGTVVPAFVRLGGFLASTFAPTIRAIADAFTRNVLPALKNLWAVVKQNLPALQAFAKFVGAVIVVVGALVLKLAGFLLPILLKVAGFLLGRLFGLIAQTIQYFGNLVRAVQGAWQGFQTFLRIAAGVWRSFVDVTRNAIRAAVGVFLGMVGTIINGAARAFGWVPGIGGKLKKARDEFNKFRDGVNAALNGVKSHKVSVTAELSAGGGNVRTGGRVALATGGPVFGAGTATSDSVPALLSNGEHVWTAKEVAAAGGHSVVQAMRKSLVRGFATGGMVRAEDGSLVPASFYSRTSRQRLVRAEDGSLVPASFYQNRATPSVAIARKPGQPAYFDVAPRLSGMQKFRAGLEEFNRKVDARVRQMWLESGGAGVFAPGSGNYGPANLHGNAANTQAAINFIRARFGLTSGGWRATGSVANSDHPRGKALDTMIPNYLSSRGIALGNAVAAYFMGNPKAFGTKYVIWRGRISEGGGWRPYFRGDRSVYGDTLAHYDHVHTSLFDRGGGLPPGLTLAMNRTGRTETVTNARTMDAVVDELRALRRDISGGVVKVDGRVLRREVNYQNIRNPGTW